MKLFRYLISFVLAAIGLALTVHAVWPEVFYKQPVADALTALSTLKEKGKIESTMVGFVPLVNVVARTSISTDGRIALSKCRSIRVQFSGPAATSLGANALFLDERESVLVSVPVPLLETAIKDVGKLIERIDLLFLGVVVFFLVIINARIVAFS